MTIKYFIGLLLAGGVLISAAPASTAPAPEPRVEKIGFGVLAGFDYGDRADGSLPRGKKGFIPEGVRMYDGQRVELTGYIMPIDLDDKGIRSFALVKDQASCCFGQAPRINHWVYVTMKGTPLREADFDPHHVVGTLTVGEYFDQGFLVGIYRLSADRVVKAGP